MCDLIYFIDWNVIRLNGKYAVMTFLFDSMSLLFEVFVFIISSLVILHRVNSPTRIEKSHRPLANSQMNKRNSSHQN